MNRLSSYGGVGFQRRHRAALDEDLLGQRDADGFAGLGLLGRRGVPAFDRLDSADLLLGRKNEPVADLERAGLDAARQDAALVEAVDVLDGKAQRLAAWAARPA